MLVAANMNGISGKVTVLDSPALTALFSVIRDEATQADVYIEYADRLLRILAEEGLARLPRTQRKVKTPCGEYDGFSVPSPGEICVVSIVRTGDILVEAVRQICRGCAVGKILIQRDEEDPEKRAKLYYSKLPPDVASRHVILCDPMLATGGSAKEAMKVLIAAGVPEEKIQFLNTVSCPEGIKALCAAYPKITVVTAAMDSHLDSNKYIVPGLGDFGDRYYST